MSDLCGPDGRLLHASAEAERTLLIQLLTKEEKEFTETITNMCALRTAIAQGATPDDLTTDQCRLMASILAANAQSQKERVMEDAEAPTYLADVIHCTEVALLAMKWIGHTHSKKGGQG